LEVFNPPWGICIIYIYIHKLIRDHHLIGIRKNTHNPPTRWRYEGFPFYQVPVLCGRIPASFWCFPYQTEPSYTFSCYVLLSGQIAKTCSAGIYIYIQYSNVFYDSWLNNIRSLYRA
jgi:hypothetical protein